MRPPRFRPAFGLLVALGLALTGCAPTSTAPSTGAALQAEQRQSQSLVQEMRRRDMLIEDPSLTRYVERVAGRIAPQRPPGAPPLRTFVVKDPDVNAFTTGAGYVFVTAGLIGALENEAQFAFVVAHEVAHVDRGHVSQGAQQRSVAQGVALLGAIAAAAAGAPPELARIGAGLGAEAVVADFSREQERQADALGLQYAAAAGWDAREGARSFAVLQRLFGDTRGAAAFFASHPSSGDRQALIDRMARAQGLGGGDVGRNRWLRETEALRRGLLQFYEAEGRGAEAAQLRRNLRRAR